MTVGKAGGCYACGVTLPPRRRRWCSALCERTWSQNHRFADAREAALRRDGHRCVRCGSDGRPPEEEQERLKKRLLPRPIDRERATKEQTRQYQRDFNGYTAAMDALWRIYQLEVNHIRPLRGKHRTKESCSHHLDNLETLCHNCHVGVTNRQRIEHVERQERVGGSGLTVDAIRSKVQQLAAGLTGSPPPKS